MSAANKSGKHNLSPRGAHCLPALALRGLRGTALLHGYRGAEPIDLHALATIIRTVIDALVEHRDIVEIDCNPVIITSGRPTVVDVLIVVRQ